MRNITVLLVSSLLGLSTLHCGGETKEPAAPATPATPAATTTSATTSIAVAQPPAAARANHSTPARCDGDGSYAIAVSCLREVAGFHFVLRQEGTPSIEASGDMARQSPGLEKVRFTLHGSGATDGEWLAQTTGRGVAWFRRSGEWKAAAEPAIANRVFQQTTLYAEPQKREGEPTLSGTETIEGTSCNHFRFTNANSGDTHDVFVSLVDGHLVRMSTTPRPELVTTFPATTITFTKVGALPAIETVR